MAMNPAAKDSNAFASSNLSGGKADSAILGVTQNPPMPSGPQPSQASSALAQQNNQSFGPQFWNTVGATGAGAGQPNYADQIAQHNAQMLQQMQSEVAPAPSAQQTYYGIGPNNELQVGDQVVPMGDNPTMAANLIQTNGHQSVTQSTLKPGFRPVTADDVNQYLSGINRSTWDTTKEVGKQLFGGAVAGIPKVAGAAADWLGAPGAGAALTGAGQAADRFLGTDQPADTLGRGTVGKALVSNAYGAGMGLPLAAANIGLTMAGQPLAAAGLDLAVAGPLFGGAAAKETADRLLEQGASPEQANTAGWQQFFLTGAAQAATNFVGGRVMAGGGYTGAQQVIQSLKSAVGKGALTAEQAAQMVTNPALLSRFAANQGVNLGLQGASMAGQGATTAAIHNANAPDGAPQDDPMAAAGQGLEAGLATGVLMSPLGIHSQMVDSARRAQMGKALNTPSTEVDLLNAIKQDQTAKAMTPEVGSLTTPAAAKEWAQGVNAKAFNNADGNQFAADTKAQQASQTAYDAAQVPPVVPKTPEQIAAEKAATDATKTQAKADKERAALDATNALIELGVAQPKGKDVSTMADILASGVDLSAPESATLRDALLARKYNLAKSELAKLKGQGNGPTGPTGPGNAGVGGAGGGKPEGSVGAELPKLGEPGAVQPGAGEPVASVQPPVVSGDASVPAAPVAPPAVAPRTATGHENTGKLAPVEVGQKPALAPLPTAAHRPAELPRPDFHLEPTSGAPHPEWHLPEEPTAPEQTDNMRPNLGKETGQKHLFPMGARGEVAKAPATPKRPVLPKDLAPVQVAVNQGVRNGPTGEAALPVHETAEDAKRSRKRQEEDAAAEAAKPQEQRDAEEVARKADNLPPPDIWNAAFGEKPGEVIGHLIAGKTAAETAKLAGVSVATVEKALGRHGTLEKFDAAEQAGKFKAFDPEDVSFARRTLEKAHEGATVRKTTAEGGAHTDNMSAAEKTDVVTQEGTQIRSSDEAVGFNEKETKLVAEMTKLQEAIKQAKAEGDTETAARLKVALDVAAKKFADEQLKYKVKVKKSDASNLDDEITATREEIQRLDDLGKFDKSDKLRQHLADLETERDANTEKELGGEAADERAQEDDVNEDAAGNSDDYLDISRNGESLAQQGYEKAEVPRVQAGRELQKLLDRFDSNQMNAGEFINRVEMVAKRLADATQTKANNRMLAERVRGADRALEVLLGARRKGELDPDTVEFAKWLLDNNPQLAEGLAIALKSPGVDTPAGRYNPFSRVATLFKEGGNVGTAVHEILHHAERMMPESVQNGIAKEWSQGLAKAMKGATPEQRTALTDMLHAMAGDNKAQQRVMEAFKSGMLDYDQHYQFVNPSEYWAVNGTRILEGRHGADTWMGKAAQWMSEFVQRVRGALGLRSDAPILKALEAITRGDGEFQSKRMLSQNRELNDIQKNIDKLPERLQDPVRNATDSFSRWGQSAIQHITFTRDLVKQGVAMGMHSLEKYEALRESQEAMSGHFRKLANDAIEKVRDFSTPDKQKLSDFLQHSTLNGEWGYGPKRVEGSKAAEMYDKLSPAAQKVAQKVFEHGAEILKAKKEAITKLADDTYGDMLAEAKKAGNTELAAEITADRANMLKRYDSLMKIDNDRPYTSARRQGDWVVVGKSKEFLAAERDAKSEDLQVAKAGQKARMDLIDDGKHYLVHEAESPAEARELIKNMRAMGFPEDLANTYYHAKDKWKAQLEGGQGVLAGMARLRSQLDALHNEAKTPEDKAKYETSRKLLTNMWLDALGSASARKSELRRLGVQGSMDMVKAFRLQSTADAHFISGIHHNAKMLNALKAANKEVFAGNSTQEELNSKQALYNEFMKRHDLSMNAPPTPVFNKIAQYTALWQIATSPAHYLGNLMQPWAMTLPYLAGRHGYAVSTKEFGKAYAEIGDILMRTGALDSLKVSDMPADVRDAMSRLLELGRLDIGMNTEYGSLELKERNVLSKAAQGAVDRIRQASLKMESLNRLASAAAAYRLEMARTGDHEASLHYAADVVAETHGDYSSTNAPRMFNSGLGKMALQFRKFQLVQLTYMAKLIGNLKDADPETRAVALRTLAYTLGHVGVLGGALAMPGFSTFSAIQSGLTKALTGIAGEDWETKLEKMIGDRDVAQLILRGVPGLAGIDLTKKVGFGDMLGVAPMANIDPTKASSVKETLGDVLSGPFGGLLARGATAIGHVQRGDYYKGAEGLMPEGIMNAMKGLRTARDGVTNTKGDKLMDVSAANAVLQALGFTPSKQAMQSAETGAMMQSTEDFKDRLDVLKTRYTNAAKSGGDVSGAVKNLNELRLEMIDRGYRPTPLGAILKAPMEQLKREMFTTPGGVQYQPKQDGRAIAQLPK